MSIILIVGRKCLAVMSDYSIIVYVRNGFTCSEANNRCMALAVLQLLRHPQNCVLCLLCLIAMGTLFVYSLCCFCLFFSFVVDNQDVDVGRYIAFCADDSALRNSVLEYGRVDSNGVPLSSSGLADGSLPSVSLPHHVEEYSDSDHHAFEKTLENGDVSGHCSIFPLFDASLGMADKFLHCLLFSSSSIL